VELLLSPRDDDIRLGFRFDLPSILDRDESCDLLWTPPVLWDFESNPVLAGALVKG
jgi:glycogen operon protein